MWPACGRVPLFFAPGPRQKAAAGDHSGEGEIADQTGTTSGQQSRDYEVASRLPQDRAGVDFSFIGARHGGTPTSRGNRGLMSDVPDTN